MVIVANLICLVIDNTANSSGTELAFLWIYTAEFIIKVLGLGFVIPRKAYLRDRWNTMDLGILVTSWYTELSNSNNNLTALRTFRILRTLRSLKAVKGLRRMIQVLVGSLKMLLGSLVVFVFFFLLFSIAGLQLFMGQLKNRCMDLNSGAILEDYKCGYAQCQVDELCVEGLDNPNYGSYNFDDIFSSLLTIFQVVTYEGWSHIMSDLSRSFSPFVVMYFLPIVFTSSFFLLNLILAILKFEVTIN